MRRLQKKEKGTSEAKKLSKVEKERELRKAKAEKMSKAEKERELKKAKANAKKEETLRKSIFTDFDACLSSRSVSAVAGRWQR